HRTGPALIEVAGSDRGRPDVAELIVGNDGLLLERCARLDGRLHQGQRLGERQLAARIAHQAEVELCRAYVVRPVLAFPRLEYVLRGLAQALFHTDPYSSAC